MSELMEKHFHQQPRTCFTVKTVANPRGASPLAHVYTTVPCTQNFTSGVSLSSDIISSDVSVPHSV